MNQGDYARKGKKKMNEGISKRITPSSGPSSRRRMNNQRLLNTSARMRPSSFNSSLPTPDPAPINFPSSFIPTTHHQLELIIAGHNHNLRNAIYASVDKQVEELAARKIHEKEMEIQAKINESVQLDENIEQYKEQIARSLPSMMNWEKTILHLHKKLQNVDAAFKDDDIGEEDTAESSNVDTVTVSPVKLDCLVCGKFLPTIMLWPCRHVCACEECKWVTKNCPVCDSKKIKTIELSIPIYDRDLDNKKQ